MSATRSRTGPISGGASTSECTQCLDRLVRRHRTCCLVAIRGTDQYANDAEVGRQRTHLHPVAHHSPVLPHSLMLSHGPQSPSKRLRPDRRGRTGFPRPHRARAHGKRLYGRGAPRERLEHLLGRQEPQRSGRRVGHGCDQAELAAGPRLRPVLRLHRRRDPQWYPNLVEDNHYVDQPYLPEDGYHLSKDLADKAVQFIADSKQSAPR
jgi:hypothetical protein